MYSFKGSNGIFKKSQLNQTNKEKSIKSERSKMVDFKKLKNRLCKKKETEDPFEVAMGDDFDH